MMFQYNANTGGFPKLGDRVKVFRSGVEVDGLTGTIGGWGDYSMLTALVALDKPMDDGRTIVSWPVVCLEQILTAEMLVKSQKKTFIEIFDELVEPKKDEDGFIVWHGGSKRPVSDSTIVKVKIRSGIPRDPIDACYWPQICWTWREADDPMNKWDIVAYKVVR